MKKVLAILLMLALIMTVIVGCAQKQPAEVNRDESTKVSQTENKPSEKEIQAEITFWSMPLVPEIEGMYEELISKFNKEYPGIKVNLEMLTWDGGPEKLQIALGTGTTPDILLDGTARTASYPSKGILVDVTEIMEGFDFYPTLKEVGKYEGKNYLLSTDVMQGTYVSVNTTLAKKLGVYDMLPADKVSWSHQDMYNFVKAATDAGKSQGIYGTALWAGSQSSDIVAYSLMLSSGGSILSEDKKTSVANQKANVDVVEFLGKMVKDGIVVPGAATLKDEEAMSLFFNQKVVMDLTVGPLYGYNNIKEFAPDAVVEGFGMPTPDGKKSVKTGTWGSEGFALFKNDGNENKIAASKAFVKFFFQNTDTMKQICKIGGNAPALQSVKVEFQDDPKLQQLTNTVTEWTGMYADSSFGILESFWPEVRSKFYPELQAVYTGKKTAQEAMDSFKSNVDTVLTKY